MLYGRSSSSLDSVPIHSITILRPTSGQASPAATREYGRRQQYSALNQQQLFCALDHARMDNVDRWLTAEAAAALAVPFDRNAVCFNKAKLASGERLEPNESVELQDGSFLRIVFITKDNEGSKLLHGIHLLRNEDVDKRFSQKLGHNLKALLPCAHDELCAILNTITDTDVIDASLVSRSVKEIRRKRIIHITNTLCDWNSRYTHVDDHSQNPAEDNDEVLYCQVKYIEKADLKRRKVSEFQIRRVSRIESDVEHGIAAYWLLQQHRPGRDRLRRSNEDYIYGDVCAGGGGTSRAAVLAGLGPQFLLDNDENACATLRLNFGPNVVLESDLCDFCQLKESGNIVDVLHVSFVCKGHSAANRGTNPERDAFHIALGYALPEILQLCKPRVVTMVSSAPTPHASQHRAESLSTSCYPYRKSVGLVYSGFCPVTV